MGMLIAKLIDYLLTRRGKLPPMNDRERKEMESFDRGSKLPNVLMVVGLILIVGVTATVFGDTFRYASGIAGTAMFLAGYFSKRKGALVSRTNDSY